MAEICKMHRESEVTRLFPALISYPVQVGSSPSRAGSCRLPTYHFTFYPEPLIKCFVASRHVGIEQLRFEHS